MKAYTPFILSALAAALVSPVSAVTTLAFYATSPTSSDADVNSTAGTLSIPAGINEGTRNFNSSVAVSYTSAAVADSAYWNGTIGLTGDGVAGYDSNPGFTETTTALAFSNGDLFTFTVQADSGFQITPDRLGFWYSADESTSAPLWEARYSINGGGFTSLGSGSVTTGTGTALAFFDLDASVIGTLTDSQTLRIDIAYAGATSVNGNFRGQDIVLTGTSAVPEPSTALLLGLASFGLIFRRRH